MYQMLYIIIATHWHIAIYIMYHSYVIKHIWKLKFVFFIFKHLYLTQYWLFCKTLNVKKMQRVKIHNMRWCHVFYHHYARSWHLDCLNFLTSFFVFVPPHSILTILQNTECTKDAQYKIPPCLIEWKILSSIYH